MRASAPGRARTSGRRQSAGTRRNRIGWRAATRLGPPRSCSCSSP